MVRMFQALRQLSRSDAPRSQPSQPPVPQLGDGQSSGGQPSGGQPSARWGSIGRSLRWSLRLGLGLGLGVLAPVWVARAQGQTLPLPDSLTALTSEQGMAWLLESEAKADYIPLSSHFVTQDNGAYCGVASTAMVLNAMGVAAPLAEPWQQPYFTQVNVLDAETAAIIPTAVIQRQGLTLAELGEIVASHGVRVERHHGAEVDVDRMRSDLIANLGRPGDFVLVNYLRRTIGQESGGHISPVAAYHAASDRFLILDVSRYKYPPVWVSAADLWAAINTVDSTSGQTRGYLLVQPE